MKQLLLILAMLTVLSVAGCAQQTELKTELVIEADISTVSSPEDTMAHAITIIEKRLDAYGVKGSIVQKQGTNLIVVQLPAVEDIHEVIDLIGRTAHLDFREQKLDENGIPVLDEIGNPVYKDESAKAVGKDGQEKELTGRYLKYAYQDTDPYEGQAVFFEWDSEGAYLFEQITERNVGKGLAICLDNEVISAPVVQTTITAAQHGYITGNFTVEQAAMLAIMLNSGDLDVPLLLIDWRDIDKV